MIVRYSFLIQKSLDPIPYNRFFLDLALPNNHDPPSQLPKLTSDFCVSFFILREFWFPKLTLRARLPILAATVLVPEAPMHEYYFLSGAKSKAVSSFLCKIFIGQFFEERQILTHFSYRA